MESMKFSDCCASSLFGVQIKMGFIRATLKDTPDEDNTFVLIEDLVNNQKKPFRSCFQVKIDNHNISIDTEHLRSSAISFSYISFPITFVEKACISNS